MTSSDTIRFICPGCGYRARIPGSFSGKVILCPGCQKMQIASPDGGVATGETVSVSKVATVPDAAAGQVSVADAQGKIRFTCAKCGFHAKLASSYAGKAIACPGCQAPQLIPPLGEARVAAVGAATSAAPATAAATGGAGGGHAAALALAEPAISMEEPTPFGEHALAGDAAGDAGPQATPAAKLAPQAAAKPAAKPAAMPAAMPAAKPAAKAAAAPAPVLDSPPEISLDAPEPSSAGAGEAERPPAKPAAASAPKGAAVKRRSSQPSTPAEPPKGVVRRGGRAGAALAAEEEAAQIAEEEEEDAEAEEAAKEAARPKELPGFLKPVQPYLERLREPKFLVLVCAGLVAVVLEILLVVAWRGNANGLVDSRGRLEKATAELGDTKDKLSHVGFALSTATGQVKEAEAKLKQALTQVTEAQQEVDAQKGKAKQAEAEHQKEYDSRKLAESKLDAALDKLAKAVQARDEDYKKRIDAEKSLAEEARLRKELKDKLDELAKAPK